MKRKTCLTLALALTLSIPNCVSAASGETVYSVSAEAQATEGKAEAGGEAAQGSEVAELFGKPWIDSVVTGNLPKEAPEAKDDLYLHYNYDELAAHQGEYYLPVLAAMNVIRNSFSEAMEAGKLTDAGDSILTDEELQQLSIFYSQASDLEALARAGISELQPYLDRIRNAASISELNEILVSDDFPFSPYLYLPVSTTDLSGVNNVMVYPEFLYVDNCDGAINFQDSDDEAVQNAISQQLSQTQVLVLGDLMTLGFSQEEASELAKQLYFFEKSYGRDAYYSYKYQDMEYGAMAACMENMSLDDFAALCPNYPVKETVEKFGKGESPVYTVFEKKWLDTFNSIWTEENLEMLKTMTMVKIIHECEPYLDPELYTSVRAMLGQPAMDAKGNAAAACDQNNTFAQLISKIYVSDQYSEEDIARLTDTTKELIAAFKVLIGQASWLREESREEALLRLDEMRLNILVPDGGYRDYSDLSLTKTEDGGTLLGNYLKFKEWSNEKMNSRIGQSSLTNFAWEHFNPSTVNCFYDSCTNSINILPGYVVSDMYRTDLSDEELLGRIGWALAHEIGHGFDFLGSQLNAYGNPKPIYDEGTLETYLANVDKLVSYIDSIEVLPGVYGAGNLWKTEAGADLIGLELVMKVAGDKSDFDYEKFFKNTAYSYVMVVPTAETLYIFLTIDGHPINYLRTNTNVQMADELYETYGIQEGDGMYLPEEERIHFFTDHSEQSGQPTLAA